MSVRTTAFAASHAAKEASVAPSVRFGIFEVRPDERRVLVRGREVPLKPRTFDLLHVLIEHRDRVVSKNELLERVWPGLVVEDNNLHVHVSALRKVFGSTAITTVAGRGYRFRALDTGGDLAERPTVPGNLPERPLTLYGRDHDLAELVDRVAHSRLVSVVGAGGVGKTRLALTVAQRLRGDYADGAWWVDLAAMVDPALVPAAVAQALGERLAGHRPPLQEVSDMLRARQLLLVMDNCEHLLEAVSDFCVAVLGPASSLRVLATSQELLHVADEHVYRLGALALPDAPGLQEARAAGAVQLFEARARALQPGFAVDHCNAADVVDICRQLDGLPLGIELAAARVRFLGVPGVRSRLQQRLELLTDGLRGGISRYPTLRAMLDWSHGLLSDAERTVFRRLAVFSGTFDLPAVERTLSDEAFDAWAVLNHLGALVDKSLVCVEPSSQDAPTRYRLLDSPRAYALERLDEAGEGSLFRTRHARAMLARFQALDDAEWDVPTTQRVTLALPDIDNLRSALEWTASMRGDSAVHVALAAASAWLWTPAGLRSEGLERLRRAGERIDDRTPPASRARWHAACVLAAMPLPGEPERALGEVAVALYRELGDRRGLFRALGAQARLLAVARRFDEAECMVQEMEAQWVASWPPYARSLVWMARGYIAYFSGRPAEAIPAYEQLLQLVSQFGDGSMERTVLIFLEQAYQALGRYEEAVQRGRALIARQRGVPFRAALTMPLANLCQALTEVGELDEALEAACEAQVESGRDGLLWLILDTFALLAARRGNFRGAALALGRSEAELAARQVVRQPNEERASMWARTILGGALTDRLVQAWLAEGTLLTAEQAAQAALSR
ncbi:winged helix-turn-helix domain-containing protein [Ideonella sp.]|uniref:ATP-binding protein n=1 Tax=Ideonella sp. TaxID=1929293 RepID=UPI0035AE90C3